MQVKFNKSLKDYKYILSFDIAKHRTGYSLLCIDTQMVVISGAIVVGDDEMPWFEFYEEVVSCIENIKRGFGDTFFITKERMPNQGGPHSNIAALQELAKAHAVFDLIVEQYDYDYYDWVGVHSVSVKAYFKSRFGIDKPSKEDIRQCIYATDEEFAAETMFEPVNHDITDSIAVTYTLINKKWNADIDTEIKLIKKEIKLAKSKKAISERQTLIKRLEKLKKEE